MPAEGFKGHVATAGSLHGKAGKWEACGWAVVQLDYDEEMGPLLGMYGSVEAEFEVLRTIKRAELTAFLCLLKRVNGPVRVLVDNNGNIDGLRRGESKCIKPRAGDADFCIKIWEELHDLAGRGHFGGMWSMSRRTECSEKILSYWQLVSVVVDEGDEACTTNSVRNVSTNTCSQKEKKNH